MEQSKTKPPPKPKLTKRFSRPTPTISPNISDDIRILISRNRPEPCPF